MGWVAGNYPLRRLLKKAGQTGKLSGKFPGALLDKILGFLSFLTPLGWLWLFEEGLNHKKFS